MTELEKGKEERKEESGKRKVEIFVNWKMHEVYQWKKRGE
jgi:hypothetical protein